MKKRAKRYIKGSSVFQIVVNVIMFLFLIIELYPIIYVVSCSFSDVDAINAGKVLLWPIGFTLKGYEKILEYKAIWVGYANTIFYTVVGTSLNLLVTLPCAYALSRKDVMGRKVIMLYFMITMYIGGGLIPSYLNIKQLGLLNTRTIILILGTLSVYNMIVCRSFFTNTIPYELTEAARIDGASDVSIFTRIILPLSKAIIVVMILYYGVGRWNAYFDAMIYIEDDAKYPLQLILRGILLQGQLASNVESSASLTMEELQDLEMIKKAADLLKYCVIVVSTAPMLLIYPKLQDYFEKGVMIGSVKG